MSREVKALKIAGTDPALRTALNAYLEYQHAQSLRRTLIKRLMFFVLGIGILSFGLHVLPIAAVLTTAPIAVGVLAVAGTNERKARRRLTDHLHGPRGR